MLRARLKRAALALLEETPEEVAERDWVQTLIDVGVLREELNEAVAGREVLATEVERLEAVELAFEEKQKELEAALARLAHEGERSEIWRKRADALLLEVQQHRGQLERLNKEAERLAAVPSADLTSAMGALREIERICSSRLPVSGVLLADDGTERDGGALAMFARQVRNIALRGQKTSGDFYLQRDWRSTLQASLDQHVSSVLRSLLRHRERYIRAWVARTGIDPRDAELVEDQREPGVTVVRVRPATTAAARERLAAHAASLTGKALEDVGAAFGIERDSVISGFSQQPETDVELLQRILDVLRGKVL